MGYRQCTLSTFIFIAELQTAKTNGIHRFVIKELGILLRFFHGPLHIILTIFEKTSIRPDIIFKIVKLSQCI